MDTKTNENRNFNEQANTRSGGISVQTEHIFPIIKKWLYSEKDIFLREIVSNASDAITKIKRLCSLGQAECEEDDYKIIVKVDKTARTLSVEDNGIGMTEDELVRYIGQIALSGALEFIEKYEGSSSKDTASNGIIGHFGLGFYSSFMVSEKVEVITKSYTGAPATRWICDESGRYEMSDAERSERGTSVIMHITEDESEYLETSKIRSMLERYCAFMPYNIYLENSDENGDADKTYAPVNITSPLWLKRPADCTEEEYREFYHKVFNDFADPLFSIHINADYPLNFKGILYFPKLRSEYDSLEGQVKLYYNQVFVADNVKEIIPDYLIMLRGIIDCPELPLNVSRSYLQSNNYVAKVSSHIVKKIADKINSLCSGDREQFEKIWNDIRVFIEYASVRDRKFFDRVKNSILLRLTDKSAVTINEYREAALARSLQGGDAPEDSKSGGTSAGDEGSSERTSGSDERETVTVYYTTDEAQQSQYIALYTAQGIPVAVLDQFIDTQFISSAESVYDKLKFVRVDADITALTGIDDKEKKENKKIAKLFRKASGNDKLEVKFDRLRESHAPALLILSEDKRRMDDFMKAYAIMNKTETGPALAEQTLVLNTESPVYKHLEELVESASDKADFLAGYIYKLSLMAHRRLDASELNAFLEDSYDILMSY